MGVSTDILPYYKPSELQIDKAEDKGLCFYPR